MEYSVDVYAPHIKCNIPICGLCGNSGVLDTTGTVKSPFGGVIGIYAPCICPNGRKKKRYGNK